MITTDTGITASNEQSEYGNNRKGSRDHAILPERGGMGMIYSLSKELEIER